MFAQGNMIIQDIVSDQIYVAWWCLLRAMHRTDMACPPINLFTYWKVVLVKLCKQGLPPFFSWKLPGKCFLQDVRERLETFLEWTPEWRRQGRKRQRMVQRKEERQRCGTRWWTDSKFLRPVLDPLGDPQQACGTWTCWRISSTGKASLRSIRLLWRTTARTEAVFCCCKDLPELDCLSPLLLADAQCPAPFWSLYLTLEDSRVVTGWQRLSGILCEGSNTNFFGRSEDSTESKSSLYVSIICYDYIIEIYLQLQSKATIFY